MSRTQTSLPPHITLSARIMLPLVLSALACGSGGTTSKPAVGTTAGGGPDATAGSGSGGDASGPGGSGSGGSGQTATGGKSNVDLPTAGSGGKPEHVVRACPTDMASVGVWEDITPQLQRDHPSYTGMLVPLVVKSDPATIYATSDTTGVFKSTDCGATWTSPATGRGKDQMVGGRQWSAAIDPDDPNTLYVINGYGAGGLWRTTDGGVNWDQMFKPDGEVAKSVPTLFGEWVTIDRTDHNHILVNFHEDCVNGHAKACFAESKDRGENWRIVDGPGGGWAEASGVMMLDSKSWLYATWFGGLWHSGDAGATWQDVTAPGIGGASHQLYQAPSGTYYLASLQGVTTSPDGVHWTAIPNSGARLHAMIGEWELNPKGDHEMRLFTTAQSGDTAWWVAKESDPTKWSLMDVSGLPGNGSNGTAYLFDYDPDHHILYASLQTQGLWRMRTY